jgi:hypothetical protein
LDRKKSRLHPGKTSQLRGEPEPEMNPFRHMLV